MTLNVLGGIAALACAATYLVGFAFLVTVLAPLGYGTDAIDAAAVTASIAEQPGLLIAWNTIIYVVNALALALLVVAFHRHLAPQAPEIASVTRTLGTIWATLVLGAGMIANVAVERTHALAADPEAAAALWEVLHAVELGLGGGNEIAGGAWILSVSIAALVARALSRFTLGLGALASLAGLATIVPGLGETAGAVFGLGAIAWFVATGIELLLGPDPSAVLVPRQAR
ncbi:hypothetical protein TG4357_02819 [Thalassovita gelatinovora]|uniref:DUF4386 domain-containing protein n=1 Tax=Thalassovita gelatinovora TaxID=53501 RepID=A0A0P1G4C5_THAGE|nr:hypothetical protein [Thalassovita gelatinovora]QIZ81824.1 hypothetical protein HFZ77_15735 [Thalassovita gelatinovora]CUH67111.1 hypothetical protein TG4357_02819 [Thalassovita gelatinovora]SEP80350.1 hypothetical protein SAMN04488043_101441 [Thalassovita gelatinovora]